MILSSDPQSEMSFEVSIPSALLLNPNIDPACVKLFAFIKSLTRAHGYCFASNGYLAKLIRTSDRSVKRYLLILKNEGYLEIEFDTTEHQCKRKIFVGKKLKNEGGQDKDVLGVGQGCPGGRTDLSCISLYSISKIEEGNIPPIAPLKEEPVEEIAFVPYVRIKKTEYETLAASYGKEALDEMIASMNDHIAANGKKPYKDYAAAIRNWFRRRNSTPNQGGGQWKNNKNYQPGSIGSRPNSSVKDSPAPVFATPEEVAKIFSESANGLKEKQDSSL
jgi:hypothetical protein